MKIVVTTAFALLFSAGPVIGETMDNCVLYAPLDEGGVVSTPADLETSWIGDEEPLFTEGKKGTALVFDSEGLSVKSLQISGSDFLNSEQGTIAFWMKPLVSYGEGKGKSVFFESRKGDGHTIFIDSPKQGFYFQTKDGDNWINPHFNFSWFKKPQWSPESWYHLAVTWGPDQKTMFYVNGSIIAKQKGGNDISFSPSEIFIGGGRGGASPSNAVIDEFYIFDKVLSLEEVTEIKDAI